MAESPLLRVHRLERTFRGKVPVRALKGVSLTIAPGESLGIADQFGSGKPTLGRRFVGLEAPDAGSIEIDGLDAGHVQGLGP